MNTTTTSIHGVASTGVERSVLSGGTHVLRVYITQDDGSMHTVILFAESLSAFAGIFNADLHNTREAA